MSSTLDQELILCRRPNTEHEEISKLSSPEAKDNIKSSSPSYFLDFCNCEMTSQWDGFTKIELSWHIVCKLKFLMVPPSSPSAVSKEASTVQIDLIEAWGVLMAQRPDCSTSCDSLSCSKLLSITVYRTVWYSVWIPEQLKGQLLLRIIVRKFTTAHQTHIHVVLEQQNMHFKL